MFDGNLREIKDEEMKNWRPQKQSVAVGIIEDFLDSDMKMAEVNVKLLPQVEPKKGTSNKKSSKQDSFASSFYAWKKKKSIKEKLAQMEITIILIRRGEKIALKKKVGKKRK